MKTIIAGSRDFEDFDYLVDKLEGLGSEVTEVVCGGARGADEQGRLWALREDIPVKVFPAKWDEYGKSSGYRRNVDMADYADMCVCFWDGKSRGTKHMANIAKNKGLPVTVFNYVTGKSYKVNQ